MHRRLWQGYGCIRQHLSTHYEPSLGRYQSHTTRTFSLSIVKGHLLTDLQIVEGAGNFQEKLVETLAQIGDVLPRLHIYEVLFKNHEQVLVALAKVYLDLLQFCVATKNFFARQKRSKSGYITMITPRKC